MSITTRMSSALRAMVGATLLLAGSSAAQTVRTKGAPVPSPALALESQARPLMDQPKQWSEMADLLAQAAQIRAADATGSVPAAAGAGAVDVHSRADPHFGPAGPTPHGSALTSYTREYQ